MLEVLLMIERWLSCLMNINKVDNSGPNLGVTRDNNLGLAIPI